MVEDVYSVPPLRGVGAQRGSVDGLQDGGDDGVGEGLVGFFFFEEGERSE